MSHNYIQNLSDLFFLEPLKYLENIILENNPIMNIVEVNQIL